MKHDFKILPLFYALNLCQIKNWCCVAGKYKRKYNSPYRIPLSFFVIVAVQKPLNLLQLFSKFGSFAANYLNW